MLIIYTGLYIIQYRSVDAGLKSKALSDILSRDETDVKLDIFFNL